MKPDLIAAALFLCILLAQWLWSDSPAAYWQRQQHIDSLKARLNYLQQKGHP